MDAANEGEELSELLMEMSVFEGNECNRDGSSLPLSGRMVERNYFQEQSQYLGQNYSHDQYAVIYEIQSDDTNRMEGEGDENDYGDLLEAMEEEVEDCKDFSGIFEQTYFSILNQSKILEISPQPQAQRKIYTKVTIATHDQPQADTEIDIKPIKRQRQRRRSRNQDQNKKCRCGCRMGQEQKKQGTPRDGDSRKRKKVVVGSAEEGNLRILDEKELEDNRSEVCQCLEYQGLMKVSQQMGQAATLESILRQISSSQSSQT